MKLENINPVSNADFLVTIEGLPETYWSKFSGVKENYNRPTYADGLSAKKRKAQTGSREVDDCTLSKPFDPEKDAPLLQWIEDHTDGTPFDVLVRPVKRGKNLEFRGTKALRLSTCRLSSSSVPGEVDAAGGDQVAMVEIVFSVEETLYAGA